MIVFQSTENGEKAAKDLLSAGGYGEIRNVLHFKWVFKICLHLHIDVHKEEETETDSLCSCVTFRHIKRL